MSSAPDMDEQEMAQSMSAQVESANMSERLHQESSDSDNIIQNLDLSGIDEWDPQMQQKVQALLHEHACIFS